MYSTHITFHLIRAIRIRIQQWLLQRALRRLDNFDRFMVREGFTRKQRRQIWRDFIAHQAVRHEIFGTRDTRE